MKTAQRQDRALYATPARDRPNYATRFEAHHLALTGHRFMPWQRQVMEVATEHDPDTGLMAYRTVVVKVPRQSGKTSLLDAVLVGRSVTWPDQGCLLMAQDRNMSRRRLIDEIADRRLKRTTAYDGRFHDRRTTGSETIYWDTGSWITIAPVTQDAGHGLTLDAAALDEIWSHEDFRAPVAIGPTMVTRTRMVPGPQLWMSSTEGTDASVLLDHWTALGRQSLHRPDSGIAYFEWAMPEGSDPYDPDLWPVWMPALGHTVTRDAIVDQAVTLRETDFLRSYCNIRTPVDNALFAVGIWESCGFDDAQPVGMLHCSADITPDRERSVIAVCGGGVVEVVDDRPGTEWVADRVAELDARWQFASIAVDNAGPGVTLVSELTYRGLRVHPVNATDMKSAFGRFYDGVVQGRLRHRRQDALDAAVANAQRRRLLDAYALTRRGAAYVSPAIAAMLAYWSWTEHPDTPVWMF